MKFVYFVSFWYTRGREFGLGNIEYSHDKSLETMEEIGYLQDLITKRYGADTISVVSFQLVRVV